MTAGRFRPAPWVKPLLGLNEAKAGVFRRAPAFQGLYPKSKPPAMRMVMIAGGGLQRKMLELRGVID